ncbi:MAG: hypothetical protein KJ597_05695, partial [Nanoarchaeota archaeon]|nr:hypothetical protein [Nanoarchaeota archaeon]
STTYCFTVANTFPNTQTVKINSSEPSKNYTNETIFCYANITDIDGDTVYANYTWYNDTDAVYWGQSLGFTANTFGPVANLTTDNTTKGENWTCGITAYDGTDYETDENNMTVNITNAPAYVQSIIINSSELTNYTNETIGCYANITDIDGDAVIGNFTWYNGSDIIVEGLSSSFTESTFGIINYLNSSNTTKWNNWTCQVRGYDSTIFTENSLNESINISNAAPIFNESLTAKSANSDQEFIYDINCSDLDGDSITYYDNTTLFNIDSDGVITDTPDQSETGSYGINISCDDGTTNTSQSFTYTINDATVPTFSNPSNTSANFRRYENFTANLTIDNLNLSYYIFNTNASGSWENVSNVSMGGVAQYNASENVNITLAQSSQICWNYWANDSSGNAATSTTYCFTVANTFPNTQTVKINSSEPSRNYTNETIFCYANVTDLDGGTVYGNYTWYNQSTAIYTGQSAGFTESQFGMIANLTPDNTTKGDNWTCGITAYDGTEYGSSSINTSITILNAAPTFNESLTGKTIVAGQTFSYDINCSDLDADNLTYYDNTTLFNINNVTGEITDTPTSGDVGINYVNITCSDGIANTSQVFNYNITATPVVVETPSGGAVTSVGGGTPQCQVNQDCGPSRYCQNFRCYDYECTQKSDCPSDEYCVNHKCLKIFDLKLLQVDSPIQPGEFLDFTYLIKSQADIFGDVTMEFWLEKDGQEVTSGADVIFIGSFEEKIETANLFLPSDLPVGSYQLYLKLIFAEYEIQSHRLVEIKKEVPLLLSLVILELPEITPNLPWNYSALVAVNKDEPVSLLLQQKITKQGVPVWLKQGGITIERSLTLNNQVPALAAGNYQLELFAEINNQTTLALESFTVGLPQGKEAFFGHAIGGIFTVVKDYSLVWLILVLTLAFLSVFLILLKKRFPPHDLRQLEKWVRLMMKNNYSRQKIKIVLFEQDRAWTTEELDLVFQRINQKQR